MFFGFLVLFTALLISGVAAWYSIVGLMAIFSGAALAIAIMGGVLEVGKLVTASWLYNYWKKIPAFLKVYLTAAVIGLMFITSMGIFGFLSKAHLDQVRPTGDNAVHIALIDKQIDQQQIIIDRNESVLDQLDRVMEVYIDNERVSKGLRERKKQKEERDILNAEIKAAMDEIARLTTEKSNLEIEQLKIEADVGPLKYVAELIYGEQAKDHFDKAVRIIIIILIFVFDPLAVLLLIAANISFHKVKPNLKIRYRNFNANF